MVNAASLFKACKENCSHAIELTPVTEGIGSAFNAVKEWSQWLGREVVVLASEGLRITKQVGIQVLKFIQACWELSKPWINRTFDFLKSSAGIVAISLSGSALLCAVALKLEDHPSRVAMVALGQIVACFAIWYGCSTGVIPLAMMAKLV